MNFCPSCGSQLMGAAQRFCHACGTEFLAGAPSSDQPSAADSSAGLTFDGYGEQAFTWTNCVRAIQSGLASAWFEEFPQELGRDAMNSLLSPEASWLSGAFDFLAEWSLAAPFVAPRANGKVWGRRGDLEERVDVASDPLVQRLEHALDIASIVYVKSEQTNQLLILHDLAGEVLISFVRVYPTQAGPVAEISTDLLIVSGLDQSQAPGYHFLLSALVAAAAVIQGAAFLAETPFPSSLMHLGRSTAYRDVPQDLRPRPFMDIEGNTYVGIGRMDGGYVQFDDLPVDAVIRLCFEISLSQETNHLSNCLAVVADAIPKMNAILTDGFATAHSDTPAPFQVVLASGTALPEGLAHEGAFEYIPYLDAVRRARRTDSQEAPR